MLECIVLLIGEDGVFKKNQTGSRRDETSVISLFTNMHVRDPSVDISASCYRRSTLGDSVTLFDSGNPLLSPFDMT